MQQEQVTGSNTEVTRVSGEVREERTPATGKSFEPMTLDQSLAGSDEIARDYLESSSRRSSGRRSSSHRHSTEERGERMYDDAPERESAWTPSEILKRGAALVGVGFMGLCAYELVASGTAHEAIVGTGHAIGGFLGWAKETAWMVAPLALILLGDVFGGSDKGQG